MLYIVNPKQVVLAVDDVNVVVDQDFLVNEGCFITTQYRKLKNYCSSKNIYIHSELNTPKILVDQDTGETLCLVVYKNFNIDTDFIELFILESESLNFLIQ